MIKKIKKEYQKNKKVATDNMYEIQEEFSNNSTGTLVGVIEQEIKPLDKIKEDLKGNEKRINEVYIMYVPDKNNIYIK